MDGPLGRRFPVAALAWQNLTRQRARSILAMAGITIGVVAIASLGMFGATLEVSIQGTFQDTASSVIVTPGEDFEGDEFDADDVRTVERFSTAPVYPLRSDSANITSLEDPREIQVQSVTEPRVFATAEEGRIPDPWRSGALVGSSLADRFDVSVGESLELDNQTVRVAAVLEPSGQASIVSTDNSVLLPERRMEDADIGLMVVKAESPPAAFQLGESLREELNDRRERFAVTDFEQAIQQFNEQIGIISTFLLAVGAVSLLVAAISILNVMLMSTIERKGEIGVLRAVGYYKRDILRLMLTEALLLGVVGAVVGLVLSVFMGMGINTLLLGDPFAFQPSAVGSVAQGFLFGTVASLLSGAYPAWKAANERPVDALRD